MKVTRRNFLRSSATAVAFSSGLLASLPNVALGNGESSTATGLRVLSNLNMEDFSSKIGSTFNIRSSNGNLARVSLISIEELKHKTGPNGSALVGFSLLFMGSKNISPKQDNYLVSHEKLGNFPLFLTSVMHGRKNAIPCYEAVINRIVRP